MSNYNPYAAPVADAGPAANVPARGEPQPWTTSEAIAAGWELYKAHWAPLTFGYFVMTFVGGLPGQVAPALVLAGRLEEGSTTYYALHGPLSFFGWVVAEFLMAGFVRATLRAVRGNDARLGDFFAAGSRFFPFLAMSFLRTLAVVVSLLGLIVGAVIVSLGFANAPYFVMDQHLGPIASLKASWEVSVGKKADLFVLGLAELGLTLAGILACCLGMFVAVPVVMLARAFVYTRMSGTAAPPAFTGPGAYAGP